MRWTSRLRRWGGLKAIERARERQRLAMDVAYVNVRGSAGRRHEHRTLIRQRRKYLDGHHLRTLTLDEEAYWNAIADESPRQNLED